MTVENAAMDPQDNIEVVVGARISSALSKKLNAYCDLKGVTVEHAIIEALAEMLAYDGSGLSDRVAARRMNYKSFVLGPIEMTVKSLTELTGDLVRENKAIRDMKQKLLYGDDKEFYMVEVWPDNYWCIYKYDDYTSQFVSIGDVMVGILDKLPTNVAQYIKLIS